MKSDCDEIRERIAAADALTPSDRAHVSECADCAAIAEARDRVARALADHRAEPGVGFEARVVAHASRRIAGRRRNAVLAAGGAALAAAAVVIVVLVGERGPSGARTAAGRDEGRPAGGRVDRVDEAPREPDRASADVETLRELVLISDVERSLGIGARWEFIEQPIAATHLLAPDLKGLVR